MKAKIIKTGEIVDVYHEPQHGQITNIYKESVLVNGRMWTENELDFCIKTNEAPEKIYVSNYSSGLTYNWHNERLAVNDIEYTRTDVLKQECKPSEKLLDVFIKNAIDFFESNFNPLTDGGVIGAFDDKEKMIEEFKEYMKEEGFNEEWI